jgi:hypothetical protein
VVQDDRGPAGVRGATGVRRAVALALALCGGAWACDSGQRLAGDDRDDGGTTDRVGDTLPGEDGMDDRGDAPWPDGSDTTDAADGLDGLMPDAPGETGTCGSGRTWCAGECVDLLADRDHCGTCDGRCRHPFADGRCIDGACNLGDCWDGYWDVDGDLDNGCEYRCGARPDPWDPGEEICNGEDDDCDGETDEDVPGAGDPCGTTEGPCEPGVYRCTDGVMECAGGIAPAIETCNGIDDDCDGDTDEHPPSERCGNGVDDDCDGLTDELPPEGPEVCNGCDDDRDGDTDEDLGSGDACGSDEGECAAGYLACVDGRVECVDGRGPTPETCDCLDNDCDAETDEGDLCGGDRTCAACICALPCDPTVEFSCPSGGWECSCGLLPDEPVECFCVLP